ncbi:MAG: lamin tail domain-containing protein, partial [Planctomycetales bacterium]|nr:lamin tail domain-containing protein [Planctomycetales bacterium]
MRQKQRLRKQLRSPECLELRQLLAADPIISEFMADNGSTLLDGDGQSSDWIELQNRGDTAVNLEGWYLTDNASNLTKWRFPSVTLDAGAFFVVFASGQDVDNYVDPGGNLHTNFGLSANGEYLGLVEPDGSTIRYEFRPEYPEQLRDISYGLQIDAAVSQPLVREGDSARLLIPNSSIDAWTEVAYGDSSWVDVSTGVGFENRDGITLPDGLQTFFGFDDAASSSTALESVTNAPVDITGASTFVAGQYEGALVFDGTTSIDLSSQPDGMRDGFTMAMWMQPTENNRTLISGLSASGGYWLGYNQGGPWLRIAAGAGAAPGSSGTFVNATATGAMSTLGQWYHLTVTFDPADTDEEVKFYVNGQKLTSGVSAADLPNGLMGDNAGTAMRIGVHNSGAAPFVGLMDEVAIYDRPITETEVLGIMNDGVIGGGPAYDEVIATNIEGSMYQVNATAYLRQTFAVEDTSQFDTLTLRVRYNDGFVAYLNGTEIARQNAPALPQWNSSATTTRVPEASAAFQDFNISQHLGLLSTTSANVLAIQGLNTSADDATFLLAPELIAAATSEELRYLDTPTPGAANTGGLEGLVGDTRFSVDRGFYEGPIDVAISTSTAGAEIRYTLDGSTPSATRGNLYTDPIHIDETTTLRAIAYKEGLISTNVDTHTYVYLADVVRQPALPAGLPSTWNNYSIGPTGTAVPADYAMDQRIVDNAAYSMDLIDGLRSIPTLSLVMEQDDWFASTQGIYVNPFSQGEGWEREVSAEWIDPQGGDEFQVNAGIRVFGGYSRHFWATPKKSFSLRFRGEYGTPRLDFPMFSDSDVDSFDLVVLRAVFSDAWPDAANPPQYLRDLYARQTQLAMGQPSSHGTWVHLYINGLYWGIYNPSERPDADYAADYFGGDETEWDAIKHGGLLGPGQVQNNTFEVVDGDSVVWQQTLALARSGLADADRYAQFTQLVDVENLADYIIVNTYLSNVDWPHKNWWANRKRDESGRWRFYNWDSEYTLNDVNTNRTGVNNTNTPAELYAAARANPEFRLLFADRVHQHLFNDGALRPEVNMERYAELAGVIEDPIVAESARWGDNGATRQGATFYTRNGSWRPTRDSLLDPENGYFARRHAIALSHYVSAGLYPSVDAAEYSQHGGHVPVDYPLTMDAPAGAIYYTLDGSDPRQGEVTVETTELLGVGAPVRLVVPTSDIGTAWRQRVFDDADWQSGSTGLGYDDSPDYDPFIGTDIESLLNPDGAGDNEYNSVYMRVPFEVEDPAAFNVLNLLMQYDDGFVAYLNGSRVALANAPVFPLWNSVALADHPDAEATAFQTFDISAFRSLLVPGTNVLAIQGLNTSGSSSDMLVTPRIEAGVASSVGISPSAMLYTGQVSLTENVNVKARVLQGSVWSALNQATFFVDRPTPLRVTEINFNPEGSDSSEFLEIQNTGDEPVELQGLHFGKGVEFVFPDIELAPGGYVVVVANQTAFAAKYDTSGIQIAGEFLSGALDNGGEGLSLVDPLGAVLLDFSYDDDWFPLADGLGFTLVLADTAADVQTLDTKNAWRPSGMIDGSPGAADSPTAPPPGAITISELVANPSDVGQDWVELFNTTDTALDLSGWYVSDDPRVPQKAQLPAETTVPAHGYLVLDEASYFGTMGSPNHVSLPADGGQFSLVAG